MQVTEVKTSFSVSPNKQARRQPFFNEEGEGSFFLKSSEHATSFFSPATIQPKLTIGQPNDKCEVEANAMVDTVVRPPGESSNQNISTGIVSPGIQRKCESCEEEENLHKKEDGFTENTVLKKSLKRINNFYPEKTLSKQSSPSTTCPGSVSIGTLQQFNHSNLSSREKDNWRTYLGVVSQMNVGPGPDHSGHCMKEQLTTISNTCPTQVYHRGGQQRRPCTGNKCLDINRYGRSGDGLTSSMVSDGPTSFIDLHRTRSRTQSLLEGTGVSSCSVVCDQIYKCDRTGTTTGRFFIIRNYRAGFYTKSDGTRVHITTGTVEKINAPTP